MASAAGTYASKTNVSSGASKIEIENILIRYGATQFMYGWTQDGETAAMVQFVHNGLRIRFILPMPDRNSRDFTHTPSRGTARSAADASAAYEQAVRQRWRALALVIKAKLEAVESGITSFEVEFLPYIVLPNDMTVADQALPEVARMYELGTMRRLLPELEAGPTG